jgi:hypothetical protein
MLISESFLFKIILQNINIIRESSTRQYFGFEELDELRLDRTLSWE